MVTMCWFRTRSGTGYYNSTELSHIGNAWKTYGTNRVRSGKNTKETYKFYTKHLTTKNGITKQK